MDNRALRQDKPATQSEAPQASAQQAMSQPKLSVDQVGFVSRASYGADGAPQNSPRSPRCRTHSTSSTPCRKRLAAALRSVRRRKHRAPPKTAADKKQRTAVKILSFEGEVDPFQFTVLSTGPLGFSAKPGAIICGISRALWWTRTSYCSSSSIPYEWSPH